MATKQSLSRKKKTAKPVEIDTSTLPPLYKCSCCGKLVQEPQGRFFKVSQNALYKGNDNYSTICNSCCNDFYLRMKEKYQDEEVALLVTCCEMGWFFSEKTYLEMKESNLDDIRLGEYIRRLNLSQNKNKTFVDYIMSSINNEKYLRSKQETEEMFEANWTEEEQKNMH